ncbi:MAG: hypothetical protein ACR2NN_28630 [Bryobacteraceae bacterium]
MPTDLARTDNSYMDLEPGWKLRIVVPLLKAGAFRAADFAHQTEDGTISLSSRDLIGYTVSYSAITGKSKSGVRIKFRSADSTRDGKTVPEPNPPSLPFQLPRQNQHIRLIYLVRTSKADHNMAIVASKRLDALNAFTKRLEENPSICAGNDKVFCSWVSAGVAVRPEQNVAVGKAKVTAVTFNIIWHRASGITGLLG